MERCNYGKCQNEATVSGCTYGHYESENAKDTFIPVVACEEHSKLDSFFPNQSQ
jgi:hypothetical protein